MPDDLPRTVVLTAKELAERWRVPVSQIYRLTRERQIPALRIGRYYRYQIEAVERFEADGGEVDASEYSSTHHNEMVRAIGDGMAHEARNLAKLRAELGRSDSQAADLLVASLANLADTWDQERQCDEAAVIPEVRDLFRRPPPGRDG